MDTPLRRQGTVCFLLRDSKVLLLLLEYPNGRRVWSGVGGMKDEDESLEDTVAREGKEELGFAIHKDTLKKVAVINESPEFQLVAFTATSWEGEPMIQEEEIKELRWFDSKEIPYDLMWPDNKYWLPKILEGKILTATVKKNVYEEELTETDIDIEILPNLI